MRPILATIHQTALAHNLHVVRTHAPHAKIMAVVKANGYGHGLLNVANALNQADGFAVLGINEAVTLRQAGFAQTLLLLEGVFSADELKVAATNHLNLVVHALPQVEMLEQASLTTPIAVHLKMNTGMNRLGFSPDDFMVMYQRLKACKCVCEITLMTHFATADAPIGIAAPLTLFKETIALLKKTIEGTKEALSLANSATILRHKVAHADWVRPGIMLYGASPVTGTPAAQFNLQPAMTLSSEIISVQMIQAGESIGYGSRFTATKTTRVGVVACGYADGYPRHAGQFPTLAYPHGAPIAVDGQLTQTLGRVSMDMLFCDLTDIPTAKIGSSVELWGEQLAVDSVAEACGTVGYELLCAVAQRVPFKVIA